MVRLAHALPIFLIAACGQRASPPPAVDAGTTDAGPPDAGNGATDAGSDAGPVSYPGLTSIPADPQRAGDPDAGYDQIINGDYVRCGVPFSLAQQVFGAPSPAEQLPGRRGDNAQLPYYVNAVVADSGVEVVAPNCLNCHAGSINGQLVVGLGNTSFDYTRDPSPELRFAVSLVTDPAQKAEMQKFADRMTVVGPYTTPLTVGVNPADNLAAILFAHHDQQTLAWSDTALLPTPPTQVVPVRVPPWWRMKKKNAMFYNAAGRRDHARLMMVASTLCTDSVSQATDIDSHFPDVEAFIDSLVAPPYPFAIDPALASAGQAVFAANCQVCHGTYGPGGSYPNLLVPLGVVGTDALLASGSQFAGPYVNWFSGSFYGALSTLDPQAGYVAPPLDGIWAAAPYFHNGSVPTLAGVLDSTSRPKYWTRTFSSTDYDAVDVGWNFTTPSNGGATTTYDTTQAGYSNQGHPFGDGLSQADRLALIEYLKTL